MGEDTKGTTSIDDLQISGSGLFNSTDPGQAILEHQSASQ